MKLGGYSCIISLLVVSNYFFSFMGHRMVQKIFKMKASVKYLSWIETKEKKASECVLPVRWQLIFQLRTDPTAVKTVSEVSIQSYGILS